MQNMVWTSKLWRQFAPHFVFDKEQPTNQSINHSTYQPPSKPSNHMVTCTGTVIQQNLVFRLLLIFFSSLLCAQITCTIGIFSHSLYSTSPFPALSNLDQTIWYLSKIKHLQTPLHYTDHILYFCKQHFAQENWFHMAWQPDSATCYQ